MPTFASKADGSQVSKAFILGNESRVHLMPFLDLNCGDIKCTHGAAVGDLNSNDLFYLSTRGISAEVISIFFRVTSDGNDSCYDRWRDLC